MENFCWVFFARLGSFFCVDAARGDTPSHRALSDFSRHRHLQLAWSNSVRTVAECPKLDERRLLKIQVHYTTRESLHTC